MSTKPIAIVTGANGVFGQYICQGIMKTHQLYCIVRNEEKGKQLLKFLNKTFLNSYILSKYMPNLLYSKVFNYKLFHENNLSNRRW